MPKVTSSEGLGAKLLKDAGMVPAKKRTESHWKGPHIDGISFSGLSTFIVCRERFRLHYVAGVRTVDEFNHRIEYGSMWHHCEEANEAHEDWIEALRKYCRGLCKQYRDQQNEIDKWYRVCKLQFPLYVKYWANDEDEKKRKPVFQEEPFRVPILLPSGREVILKGIWDSVDRIGKKLLVKENKTKGDIKEDQLLRQLKFDLQTMIYVVALEIHLGESCHGVRYNVVRRPLSGGRGNIRPHKARGKKPAETTDEYYGRLFDIINDDLPYFFMRWRVELTRNDIDRFKVECLYPWLEQLCDWWEWVAVAFDEPYREGNIYHARTPYGLYNPLADGRSTDLDDYIETGSTTGLRFI